MATPAVIPKPDAWARVAKVVRAYESAPRDERANTRGGRTYREGTCLKITGNATCGGIYNARIWLPPASIDPTISTFSGSILGTDPGSDNAYLINLPEITLTTHDLTDSHNTNQKFFIGLRWTTATDGKPCFLCLGFWNEDCS